LEASGSYVKNQQTNKSDLDLLVYFTIVPSILKFLELKNYLSISCKLMLIWL
jgi:uncharacterized protein